MKPNLIEILKQIEARPRFDGAKLNITEQEWKDFYVELGFWYHALGEKVEGFEKELRKGLNIHQADAKSVCCRKLIKEILGESP